MLSAETGLSIDDLERIASSAPRRYKVFEIPKRDGGMREIAQPSRELKLIQRAIVKRLLSRLPVHEAALAYRSGLSIRNNAMLHAGSTPILKMDFQNFFPSIRSEAWEQYCRENALLRDEDINFSVRFLFRQPKKQRLLRLSIGAPSSPALSNALLFRFDELVSKEASRHDIHYTRYADDLTFSGQRIGMLKDMPHVVASTLREMKQPKLTVNTSKTHFITSKRRRCVTGVILSNEGTVGLGREKRRILSAQVHHAKLRKLDAPELAELRGQLAFANVVEPKFVEKLREKYGDRIVTQIQKTPWTQR
jgi:RNA-directed DNA polymerase